MSKVEIVSYTNKLTTMFLSLCSCLLTIFRHAWQQRLLTIVVSPALQILRLLGVHVSLEAEAQRQVLFVLLGFVAWLLTMAATERHLASQRAALAKQLIKKTS